MTNPRDPSGPVCPLCRRENVPIADTSGAGDFIIDEHTHPFPIFPFGYGADMYKIVCPASGARLVLAATVMPGTGSSFRPKPCDGEHAAPMCGDPQCYHREDAPDRAFPDEEPLVAHGAGPAAPRKVPRGYCK